MRREESEVIVTNEVVRGPGVKQRAERTLRAGDVETDEGQSRVAVRGGGIEVCVKHGGLGGPVAGPGPLFQPVGRPAPTGPDRFLEERSGTCRRPRRRLQRLAGLELARDTLLRDDRTGDSGSRPVGDRRAGGCRC
ncbi:hypothetical protein PF003_g28941 [Phytophthora fragariae]|nr:hypothetical protein PF003_g28941 [Phytophthora fragariae]